MGKKYRNLMPQIVDRENMEAAYRQTAKGRRQTRGYLDFKEYAPLNLAVLADEIGSGEYRPGPFYEFQVRDPKPRKISALSFRDRIAQHALCNVIGPIIDRALLPRCFACRPGKGTHMGVKVIQSDLRHLEPEPTFFLKTDFSKYFASIDRRRLHGLIRKKISCQATLKLIEAITPLDGQGIPIGSLTSQFYANLYGTQFDRLIQQEIGLGRWGRYMDDILVLHHSAEILHECKSRLEALASNCGLRFSKWQVSPVARGVPWLGYRIWPHYKLMRRQSIRRAQRHLQSIIRRGDRSAEAKFRAAWQGHCRWADYQPL